MSNTPVRLSRETADEIAELLTQEAEAWADDRGDPGDSVTGAEALAELLRTPGPFIVVVLA